MYHVYFGDYQGNVVPSMCMNCPPSFSLDELTIISVNLCAASSDERVIVSCILERSPVLSNWRPIAAEKSVSTGLFYYLRVHLTHFRVNDTGRQREGDCKWSNTEDNELTELLTNPFILKMDPSRQVVERCF
jgi:hypothetical protein